MIRRLSPELIREIAAGEVISAPVDVVRELLENALDAGATRIDIALSEGGLEAITVQDNGDGMTAEELPLALEPHSTSKLQSLAHVHAIRTLGFRGEGLHAIRYAAAVTIASRPSQQLGGTVLQVDGENSHVQRDQPLAAGTRVQVHQLFARLPARRAALDSPQQEAKRVLQLVQRYMLHYPSLQLRLTFDDVIKLHHSGSGLLELIKQLWGVVSANRLLAIDYGEGDYHLHGMLSRPELTRPRRDRLHLAINGRPVQWQDAWLETLLQHYGTLLPKGQVPVGVLNLSMPAEQVLVNTSPDKSQVRLLAREPVLRLLGNAVEDVMRQHPLSPSLPSLHQVQPLQHAPRHGFPQLHYLASYRQLYLLAEADNQLWVIDQHAAHERVVFEELQRRYQHETPVQLARAEIISLNPEEIASLEARREGLAARGLVVEPFGSHSYAIRSVPALLLQTPHLIEDVLRSSLLQHSLEQAWREVLARLACLPAVKAGYVLANEDAQALLDRLAECTTPWVCPHGRPTALVMRELELARRFGRRAPRATGQTQHNLAANDVQKAETRATQTDIPTKP